MMLKAPKHVGTIMGSSLDTAKQIHIAMAHSTNDYALAALLIALHSVLIVVEEARQSIAEEMSVRRVQSELDHES